MHRSFFPFLACAVYLIATSKFSSAEVALNSFNASYNYTNSDVKTVFKLQLSTPYVCKWGAPMPGINFYQSILYLPPCNYITPHYHPETNEVNYMMQGQVNYWIFPLKAAPFNGTLSTGESLLSPQGVMHMFLNDGCEGATMFHTFTTKTDENFMSAWGIAQKYNSEYLSDVFPAGTNSSILQDLRIPDKIHTLNEQCIKRCNIKPEYWTKSHCPETPPLTQDVYKLNLRRK